MHIRYYKATSQGLYEVLGSNLELDREILGVSIKIFSVIVVRYNLDKKSTKGRKA